MLPNWTCRRGQRGPPGGRYFSNPKGDSKSEESRNQGDHNVCGPTQPLRAQVTGPKRRWWSGGYVVSPQETCMWITHMGVSGQ